MYGGAPCGSQNLLSSNLKYFCKHGIKTLNIENILKKYIKDSHNSTKIGDLTPCFLNMEWNGTLFIIQSTSKVIKVNYVWIKSQ